MTKSVRRLAELFAPAHYNVNLNVSQRVARTFSGSVTIEGESLHTAERLMLHAKGLTVTNATIDGTKATTTLGDDDELHISTGHDITADMHTVHIDFTGTITDPMQGIYPCYFTHNGEPKELLMTQLESHYAREAFPCIDEPSAKATFELTLITEPGISVLSNTPVATQTTEGKTLVTTFESTPKMSTYLLAFVTGDLVYKEVTNDHNVKIRIYATPDHKDELGFALHNAARFLDFLDDFFGTPYPLPKCDLIACPDFAAGAMENWGLLTFREAALLVNEKDTPADSRQHIAGVIAHELAHQWFGDLVTMDWWDYLWLNESFANFMESYVPAHFYPEWQLWEQYNASEQQFAFTRDGLASVQPVQMHVHHPNELGTAFDPAIVYAKGGSLIRMLHDYIGDQAFRDGLRIYMKRHAYSNTTGTNLWKALSEASGKNISKFMDVWVTQPGHPVVNIDVHDGHATASQHRFYSSPVHADSQNKTLWPIPLLSSSLPDAELLADKTSTFVVAPADYHLLNEGGTGFYHVRYDQKNLAHIAHAVGAGKLTTIDRQKLLTDSVALNRAGLEPTLDTLRLLSHYDQESDYAVWLAISSALGALRTLINDDPAHKPDLQRFIATTAQAQFERLGWDNKKGEPHFDELLRPIVLANMAYADDPEVIARCLALFAAAKQPEDLSPDTRSIVYSIAVREKGQPAITKLLTWYHDPKTSADERVNLVAGITSMRDPKLAEKTLALITTKAVKLQDVFYWFVYHIRNRHTRRITWRWMQNHWGWIEKNFDDHDRVNFAKYSAGAFSTADELAMFKDFFEPKLKTDPSIVHAVHQGFEDIEIRMLWRERDLASVAAFLKKS